MSWRKIFLCTFLISLVNSSELGAVLGDGAASQMLRHAAQLLLAEPRYIEAVLTSRESPGLSPLASIDMHSKIGYQNLSLHFKDRAVTFTFTKLKFRSSANVTHLLWPLDIGEHMLDMNLEMPHGKVNMIIGAETMSLQDCYLLDPKFEGSLGGQWFVEGVISKLTSIFSPGLDSTLCYFFHHYLADIPHSNIMRFPIHSLLPPKAREFLAHNETNLFYRLNSVDIHEHQMTIRATIEWNKEETGENPFKVSNTSQFEMELKGDDRVTFWIEDTVLNELINQVEWDFEWMSETVPVTSPIIPPDSKGFLSTLCIDCYFLLNVSAKGNPTIQATNESLVFEKTDRVNLRVVNPDRNVTSVFASFVLTIQAQLQPIFDDGVLRTLVQLLDTKIVMEDGAFPKAWRFYMEDLMRGMILDMLWPEIKKAIEELSYGKGLKISSHCGLDPFQSEIDFAEGSFAITTRLALHNLDIERCFKEMKSAIPNTSKLFQKLDPIA
ncbi:unnamed protein product, partial [Mesorhabditis belari]|uniref:Uncharacterized protein n=1 Tax=Mesorhabditis belari TaxID=2138241 RepID=A0AAF3FCP1_9BILA